MTNSVESPLADYCLDVAQKSRQAAVQLATVRGQQKHTWLLKVAADLRARTSEIVTENAKDLAAGENAGLSSALLDRLKLNPERIESLACAVEEIAALPDPVGEVIEGTRRPNGLTIEKIRVPLGVIFFIYESRPNVTIDAAALCIKSGNAVILRG
ncbi:MAG: gamma-glutamyl-phosphate reductase, partial [Planctomycetaceae bacterium]|nr:gamma-glutamyl-phosphate reductase [Planctomycetaceae bacterium]